MWVHGLGSIVNIHGWWEVITDIMLDVQGVDRFMGWQGESWSRITGCVMFVEWDEFSEKLSVPPCGVVGTINPDQVAVMGKGLQHFS